MADEDDNEPDAREEGASSVAPVSEGSAEGSITGARVSALPPPPARAEPPPVRTTSATPPPLESDPFAITGLDDPPPNSVGAVSSGAFEIPKESFSQVPSEDLPPSTVIANAMGRHQPGLSLGAIAGIGAGVLIVAIGLALLLFR